MEQQLNNFENKIGYTFKNKLLLKESLTHSSYVNEHKNLEVRDNERLEFLGDAVLGVVISDFLYKKYPNSEEGDLSLYRSTLVKTETLSKIILALGIESVIMLSKGQKADGKQPMSIYAGVFEALVGAVYLDGGFSEASNFIERFIIKNAETIIDRNPHKDPKTYFQEKMQSEQNFTPTYELLKESGPAHNKEFIIGVFNGDKCIAKGKGISKKDGEKAAAKEAIKKMGL
ncbi:MAG: ribonuclease III [Candidatus Campbellbacteria bacterium]|nr:ribonuclease III [Candidatus Campbellbacteria bacterium]